MNKMGSFTVFPVDWDTWPKIVPPASKTDKIIEAIALIGVLLSVIIAIICAVNLSDIIPGRYYPLSGVNTYWSGWPSLASFSLLTIIIYALGTVSNRYPYTFKYHLYIVVTEENAPRLYSIGRRALLYIKTVLVWMSLTGECFFPLLSKNPEPSTQLGFILVESLFFVVLIMIGFYAINKILQEYKPQNRI
jgi:hypothetical protein